MVIIDAALTCFAAEGYHGTTTAAICRRAGIGSGTFFHYYPTKVSVLLAILEHGSQETRDWFAAQHGREDARAVILDWVRYSAAQSVDPRLAGFIRAVGAVMTEPEVADALTADEQAQRDGMLPWVRRARSADQVRADLSARELTAWVMLVLDGFLGRIAADPGFTARRQSRWLTDTVERLIDPR